MEEQRKSRIFNAKTRIIGVDRQALDQQMHDRQYMDELENKRSQAFASDAVRNDMIAELLQKRQEHDIRELNMAQNEFRFLHQQPSQRREWDLYDPEAKKKDKPARVSDDDARLFISGMQKFDGEDLNNKARTQFQHEQLREWSSQQKKEREQADNNQKAADRLYQLKARELDQRACELQTAEQACRRNINVAVKDYNNALSRENEARRNLNHQQTEDDNHTEMANMVYGDFLTENPAVAQSAFGAHRVIPDRWKGMSPEQLADIRRTQELQEKENKRLRDEDKRRDDEFERQANANARAGELLERQKQRQEDELAKQLADENRRLGREQHAHKDYMHQEVYTNEPTAAYFMQFNTTTR